MMATVAVAARWSVPVPSLSDRRSPVGITGSKKKKKAVTGPGRCGYRCPVLCAGSTGAGVEMRTCKNCKTQYDPSLNHPLACRFHTAHFGGETKRKFESVYTGGTMSTPDSGQVFQYWHCCGSEDPFNVGCTAAPHFSYDD